MKILYGIQLTGNGHITRSIEIIRALKENGFYVDIITSGNNSQIEIPFDIKSHHNGKMYYNTGDMVESCSYLVEDLNGNIELRYI